MLFISRHVNRDALPPGRTVIQFEFPGVPTRRIWMTLEPGDVSVCLSDPSLPIDLFVTGSVSDLFEVYMGRITLAAALTEGRVRLDGARSAVRAFHRWMRWSSFADAARAGAVNRPTARRPSGPATRAVTDRVAVTS